MMETSFSSTANTHRHPEGRHGVVARTLVRVDVHLCGKGIGLLPYSDQPRWSWVPRDLNPHWRGVWANNSPNSPPDNDFGATQAAFCRMANAVPPPGIRPPRRYPLINLLVSKTPPVMCVCGTDARTKAQAELAETQDVHIGPGPSR